MKGLHYANEYLVTDRDFLGNKDLVVTVEEAIKGGVTLVQIREKKLSI
jgi:thiamine-phosphate pyrophosphorylase